jgi:hypothetical protein
MSNVLISPIFVKLVFFNNKIEMNMNKTFMFYFKKLNLIRKNSIKTHLILEKEDTE